MHFGEYVASETRTFFITGKKPIGGKKHVTIGFIGHLTDILEAVFLTITTLEVAEALFGTSGLSCGTRKSVVACWGLRETEKGEYDEEALCDAFDDVAKEWFNIMAGRKRKAAKRGQGFMEGFALGQQKQRQQGGARRAPASRRRLKPMK